MYVTVSPRLVSTSMSCCWNEEKIDQGPVRKSTRRIIETGILVLLVPRFVSFCDNFAFWRDYGHRRKLHGWDLPRCRGRFVGPPRSLSSSSLFRFEETKEAIFAIDRAKIQADSRCYVNRANFYILSRTMFFQRKNNSKIGRIIWKIFIRITSDTFCNNRKT